MASVSELLLAAEAKKKTNPLVDLLQSGIQGYQTGLGIRNQRLDIVAKLLALENERRAQAAQNEMRREAESLRREQDIRAGHDSITPTSPTTRKDKVQMTIKQDEKGRYSRDFKVIESPVGSDKTYTPEQLNIIETGTNEDVAKAFGGTVPKDVVALRVSQESRRTREAEQQSYRDENRIRDIRREITGSKTYQAWTDIKSASDNLEDAAANPSAKRSLGAIYSYVKALDPGSVVREGEIKLAGEARNTATRLEGYFRRIATGELLLPEEVRELADWAKTKEGIARKTAINSNKPAIEQARRNQYDLREINSDLFGESNGESPADRKARLLRELEESR